MAGRKVHHAVEDKSLKSFRTANLTVRIPDDFHRITKAESCSTLTKKEILKTEQEQHEELEERFNTGWEKWVAQMGGDADVCSYNFEAEELAVRLGTHLDKAAKLHAKILLQKIYHFWNCKQHTDMVLIADPVREEVHFHMFLAHSEFYDKIVLVPDADKLWKEGKLVIDLTGMVSPKALKTIVSFVYTGAIKLTLDNVTDLAMAAKNMGLRKLQQQCMEFLDYVFADFHLFIILRNVPVDHKFFDVAWTKILKRFRHISLDRNFLELDPVMLELLLASDKLNVESEYQVFKAAINWMNHDRHSREKFFFKLMAQVRFAYMDLEELIQCMQEEDMFKNHSEAAKMLEEADMYATMDSMGDTWCNYPPWPPRNDTIARKVEARKEKLKRLRPRSKADICNEDLSCPYLTNYGGKYDLSCPPTEYPECPVFCAGRTYGNTKPPESCGTNKVQPNPDYELFGLTEAPEAYKGPTGPPNYNKQQTQKKVLVDGDQTSTNRVEMLYQLRAHGGGGGAQHDRSSLSTPQTPASPHTTSTRTTMSMGSESTFNSKEPTKDISEISLPSIVGRTNRTP